MSISTQRVPEGKVLPAFQRQAQNPPTPQNNGNAEYSGGVKFENGSTSQPILNKALGALQSAQAPGTSAETPNSVWKWAKTGLKGLRSTYTDMRKMGRFVDKGENLPPNQVENFKKLGGEIRQMTAEREGLYNHYREGMNWVRGKIAAGGQAASQWVGVLKDMGNRVYAQVAEQTALNDKLKTLLTKFGFNG